MIIFGYLNKCHLVVFGIKIQTVWPQALSLVKYYKNKSIMDSTINFIRDKISSFMEHYRNDLQMLQLKAFFVICVSSALRLLDIV